MVYNYGTCIAKIFQYLNVEEYPFPELQKSNWKLTDPNRSKHVIMSPSQLEKKAEKPFCQYSYD